MSIVNKQLSLNLCLKDDATFNNFYGDANQEVVGVLQTLQSAPDGKFIYLWGMAGSGCSHLLAASCHRFGAMNLRVAYLPLNDFNDLSPDVFEDLDQVDLLCLDNVEAICGDVFWEEAIFHCVKKLQGWGGNLLIAANASPKALNMSLPDLQSRFCGSIVFKVEALDDDQKLSALRARAELRGLVLERHVANFLLNRYDRDTNSLFDSLDILDKSALQAQRRLTIPFVKQVLQCLD